MADKFRGKYRIPSARLKSWNYGSNAPYFVTICTQGMVHHFGKTIKGKMHKNKVGLIAEKFWYEIPKHFSFVLLDAFTVMPNHIHGILVINKHIHQEAHPSKPVENSEEEPKTEQQSEALKAGNNSDKANSNQAKIGGKNPKWKPGTLGVILNQYKRICTINMRNHHPDFDWKERYYDHIIRNVESFYTIRNYILHNPENWDNDKFNER